MKKFIIVLTLIILISCGKDNSTVSWLKKVDTTYFNMQIPEKWEVIDPKSDSIPKPKTWNVELVWLSDNVKYWFLSNIIVLSQKVEKVISSKDFSIVNYVWATWEYSEFTKLDSEEFVFEDWDKSTLYTFEAKYNIKSPKLKYLQIWKICNVSTWLLITVGISTDIKNLTAYKDILKTFKCL